MTFWEDILAIICGVIIADGIFKVGEYFYERWRNKDKIELEELKCDLCKEPRKLVRTPDSSHHWLCATCMQTYLTENQYSDPEKEKILDSYKKRPKRRRRK